jgi:hypothetical protein
MKPTRVDITKAMAILSGIQNFPTQDIHQELVRDCIAEMVGELHQLEWVTRIAYKTMRWWSLPEFRGLFCSRFKPADGIWEAATTPGFTPDEAMGASERAYLERESKEYDRKLAAWKEEAKLLGPGEPEPFELPAAKPLPALPPAVPEPSKPTISLREAEEQLEQQLARSLRRSADEAARLIAELEQQLESKKKVTEPEAKWVN